MISSTQIMSWCYLVEDYWTTFAQGGKEGPAQDPIQVIMQVHQGFICLKVVEGVSASIEGLHLRDPKPFWERIRHDCQGEGMVGSLHQGLDYRSGFSPNSFHHDIQLILHLLHPLFLVGSGSSSYVIGLLRYWGSRPMVVSLLFFLVSLSAFFPGVGNFLHLAIT